MTVATWGLDGLALEVSSAPGPVASPQITREHKRPHRNRHGLLDCASGGLAIYIDTHIHTSKFYCSQLYMLG